MDNIPGGKLGDVGSNPAPFSIYLLTIKKENK